MSSYPNFVQLLQFPSCFRQLIHLMFDRLANVFQDQKTILTPRRLDEVKIKANILAAFLEGTEAVGHIEAVHVSPPAYTQFKFEFRG